MAKPTALDPSPFDPFPEIDPSDPLFLDPHFFPDDFHLPHGLTSDFDFDDIDLEFSFDDLVLPPEDHEFPPSDGSPAPDSNEGSGVSSSSPVSGKQSFDHSGNANSSSLDSSHSHCSAAYGVIDQEVKLDEERTGWGLKRKKRKEDGTVNPNPNPNPRNSKLRRSEEANSSCVFSSGNEEEEKRKSRLMRNRESAQLSRQRKKHYVDELEDKMRSMNSMIAELNSKISFFMAENASLRQQLNGNRGSGAPSAAYPPPPPMTSMHHFPWIPYSGFPLRPNGSQVPLVPIPRLKPQQPVSAPKTKKSGSKKGESKTKKVASVSLLGLLFVMLIFGGVVPGVNLRSGGGRDVVSGGLTVAKGGFFGQSKGRVLSVSGHTNGLSNTDELRLCSGKMGFGEGVLNRVNGKRCHNGMVAPGSDGSVFSQNSSETLPALLYVPRNGKHVKINGNLIIHSILASERAIAQAKSRDQAKQSSEKEGSETGLAIAGNMASALAVSKSGKEVGRHPKSYRSSAERQRALASKSEDIYGETLKSAPTDGPLQQWFREGLAGPILSSGTCTEVFQFEVSPSSANPGGIVPATSMVNATDKLPPPSGHPGKMKNRRILYPQPIPLNGSTLNNTRHFGKPSESNSFHGNTSVPSMVVSVMADPREAGNGDDDGMISPKSLSRIFVVVLMDRVKYVTYSCVLPLKSNNSPHLVN